MPRAGWRAGAVAVLLAGIPAADGLGRAQSAPDATDVIDVTLIGAGADGSAVVDTLREILGRLGLSVAAHVQSAPGSPGTPLARVVVEIDFSSPGDVVLSVHSDASHAPAHRRIARDAAAPIIREEVADAVSSMVEAQLVSDAARDAAAPPNEPPPEPPVAAPPPPPAEPPGEPATEAAAPAVTNHRWIAVDVTTFAGAGPFAGNVGVVGRLRGGLALASRRGLRPSLTIMGEGLLPFYTQNVEGVTAHTDVESFRAIAAIEILRADSWLAIDVGAGFGFDILSVDPNSVPASAPTSTVWDPVVSAIVTANFALTPGVMFTVAIAGDADLESRSYLVKVIAPGSTRPAMDPLLSPWVVRPAAFAGFTITAFGDGRFASREVR